MRPIDADELLNELDRLDLDYGATGGVAECIAITEQAPTIDAVKVVRCKDCRHADCRYADYRKQMPNQVYCHRDKTHGVVHDDDDFCKYGERREP